MKYYIDSVSAIDWLFRYEAENKRTELTAQFTRCFFDGSEISRCGRRVIKLSRALENIAQAVEKIEEKRGISYLLTKILESVLKGVTDNAAVYSGNSYFPLEPTEITDTLHNSLENV